MWQITSDDILRLQGNDKGLVSFVDTLLRGTLRAAGAPESEVIGNLRTKAPDGGVDTEVRRALTSDVSGWIGEKTVWQYKAEKHNSLSTTDLQAEISGKAPNPAKTSGPSVGKSTKAKKNAKAGSGATGAPPPVASAVVERYVIQKLKAGYAYRLCIADQLTAEKITDWEQALAQEIQKVAPGAPAPRVVSADALAAWGNHLPVVAVPHLRPELWGLRSYDNWGDSITAVTSTYVDVDAWSTAVERVAQHVDFGRTTRSPVITVHGHSGVGKTRLVYEAVRAASSLVIYTADEDEARRRATEFATRPEVHVVLIADECSLARRQDIERVLRGHTARIRVVAIDNTSGLPSGHDDLWLRRIEDETVDRIIEKNFPQVTLETRQEFVRLSKGFVRLAADLCEHANDIVAAGNRGPVLRTVDNYLEARFQQEHSDNYRVLQLLALVDRLGWRRGLESELEALRRQFSMPDLKRVSEIILDLNQRTGFVNVAGPYCYVTPEIVAESAFRTAWKQLVTDKQGFLEGLPAELAEPFQRRVGRTTDEEVRRFVGEFFRRRAEELIPSSLATRAHAVRLVSLIKIAPATYLPTLRSLLERSSREELRAITGSWDDGDWGPRRHLVDLLEGAASIPEHFDDAEVSLRRLALEESEPGIGNNATAIWRALFAPVGSGTAVSFFERAARLEELLRGEDLALCGMAIGAVNHALSPISWRLVGATTVFGGSRPEEWRPRDGDEQARCGRRLFELLRLATEGPHAELADAARGVAIEHLRNLLGDGHLEALRPLLTRSLLSPARLSELVDAAEEYVRFDAKRNADRPGGRAASAAEVREWVQVLTGDDVHGRLVAEVSLAPYFRDGSAEANERNDRLDALAVDFVARPSLVAEERAFLASPLARGTVQLGGAIARRDADFRCRAAILNEALSTRYTGLARGYIGTLLETRPDEAGWVNAWLDRAEREVPAVVADVWVVHPELLGSAERLLRLVQDGSLPVEYLAQLEYLALRRNLAPDALRGALLFLRDQKANRRALRVAVSLIGDCFSDRPPPTPGLFDAQPDVRAAAWELLRAAIADPGVKTYDWERAVEGLGAKEPAQSVETACLGLTADAISFHEPAERLLLALAASTPDLVAREVSRTLLDGRNGRHFYVGRYRALVQGLPLPLVKDVLASTGVEGARRLARHLSLPHIDAEGRAIVPELTAYVLETFGDDERTFREFCAGGHSLQLYSGDIAAQHDREAEVARRFLRHPLRRVREWARYEEESARRDAVEARERDALDAMP